MALQWLLLTGGPDLLTGPLRLWREALQNGSTRLIGLQLMQVLVALLGD